MKTIAILVTLDTKSQEAGFIKEQVEHHGARGFILDMGVVGKPGMTADISREDIASAGGAPLSELLKNPSREVASPVMIAGATQRLAALIAEKKIDGIIGLGGTQGTTSCTQVMQEMGYGLPKVMVSTAASGDTGAFVGIKDITMMFSVSDILGLNAFLRQVLANAAGAAVGMANAPRFDRDPSSDKPLIGMSNLGVLTEGAMKAIEIFEKAGYEVITFHAVGSGGKAMEQMMREGLIGAVFDYALGEIADGCFDGLRAADESRLTVAAELGLPQVICPGGAEHIGLFVDTPNEVPDRYKNHTHTFHTPVIFVPRLNGEELTTVAHDVTKRLANAGSNTAFLIPEGGTGSYSVPGGPLHDLESDRVFFDELEKTMPEPIEFIRHPGGAEDLEFVEAATSKLIQLIRSSA